MSQHRRSLNTYLARGRKWTRLVDELGFGIRFIGAWYAFAHAFYDNPLIDCRSLAKAKETSLDSLIDLAKTSEDKIHLAQNAAMLELGSLCPYIGKPNLP